MIKHATDDESNSRPQLTRSTLVLRRLQAALPDQAGKSPGYNEIEDWTGVAEGTIKDWFNNKGRPTLDFCLQLMERIPDKARHQILDSACKIMPALDHPRFMCDQTIISHLKTIACVKNGITFIEGESDEARTFLISALANSFLCRMGRPYRVIGFDVHEPDWFVPVLGVRYLHNQLHPEALRVALAKEWRELDSGRSNLILLNGIWSMLPELQKDILAFASRHPVVVADGIVFSDVRQKRFQTVPANLVSVSRHSETEGGIVVSVKAF